MDEQVRIYFTDFFRVTEAELAACGRLNVSPIHDLPLFIDPLLLFDSKDDQYKTLHDDIIRYVRFLREVSADIVSTLSRDGKNSLTY